MNWNEVWLNTWQTTLVFAVLLILTRLLGKTQVGQLTFYEYISGITIGSIAGTIVSSEPDEYWLNFYDLIIFIALTWLMAWLTLKSRLFRQLVEGSPALIIENGQMNRQNMRSAHLDIDQLLSQLRVQGILDIDEVQYAFLESTGGFSIIKKPAEQTVTKKDMAVPETAVSLPTELILDGKIQPAALKQKNLSRDWLTAELNNRGINNPETVFYAVIDSHGRLMVHLYNK